jgi:hypothetical protein
VPLPPDHQLAPADPRPARSARRREHMRLAGFWRRGVAAGLPEDFRKSSCGPHGECDRRGRMLVKVEPMTMRRPRLKPEHRAYRICSNAWIARAARLGSSRKGLGRVRRQSAQRQLIESGYIGYMEDAAAADPPKLSHRYKERSDRAHGYYRSPDVTAWAPYRAGSSGPRLVSASARAQPDGSLYPVKIRITDRVGLCGAGIEATRSASVMCTL